MKNTYRRYYLHRKIKKFAKIQVKQKTIAITDEFMNTLNEKQQKYINEMKEIFHYSLQFEIG